MMLGPANLVPQEDILCLLSLYAAAAQGPSGWQLDTGATIPAWTAPDHVMPANELGSFFPGSGNTDANQGGFPWGILPPLDDNFYLIQAAYEYYRLTGISAYGPEPPNGAPAGAQTPIDQLFQSVRADGETGVVVAPDWTTANAKDFGFRDSVFIDGKVLFPSILKFVAANQLAEMAAASGQVSKSGYYAGVAAGIQAAIPALFLQSDGWLHASTGYGGQQDVWGTAYAVASGAVSGNVAATLAETLANAYLAGTTIKLGQVRELPVTEPLNNGYWQGLCNTTGCGDYQNGGYWGTATGWYIVALACSYPDLARGLAQEYMSAMQASVDSDGHALALEWVDPDNGQLSSNTYYVATIALTLNVLQSAGLTGNRVPLLTRAPLPLATRQESRNTACQFNIPSAAPVLR